MTLQRETEVKQLTERLASVQTEFEVITSQMSGVDTDWGRLAPNGTNLGLKDQFLVYFGF